MQTYVDIVEKLCEPMQAGMLMLLPDTALLSGAASTAAKCSSWQTLKNFKIVKIFVAVQKHMHVQILVCQLTV